MQEQFPEGRPELVGPWEPGVGRGAAASQGSEGWQTEDSPRVKTLGGVCGPGGGGPVWQASRRGRSDRFCMWVRSLSPPELVCLTPPHRPPAAASPSWKLSKEISGFTLRYPRRKEGTGSGAGGHLEEEGTSGREKGCPGERRGETWTEVCTVD